jgi:hypothetical protein
MVDAFRSALAGFRVVLCIAGMLAASAGPAGAAFIITNNSGSAFAQTTYPPPFTSQRNERFFGPNGGAAVGEVIDPFSHQRAAQTDFGLNAVAVEARVGDASFFSHSAGTTLDVTVGNSGPLTSDPLIFEFHLNGGILALLSGGSFDGLIASVSASIFTIAPGRSGFLWSWTLSLRGQGGAINPSVDFLLDPLGFGVPAITPVSIVGDEAGLTIAPFTLSADLGRLSPGGTAFVTYDMDANVSGPGFNGTGGRARLGDPLNLPGNPGGTISFVGVSLVPGPAAASEPAALSLGVLGLMLLAVVRLRERTAA